MANPLNANLQDIEGSLQNGNLGDAAEMSKAYFDNQDNIPLNIAITGDTGTGKSTFVNAIRGVDNKDANAAPTGPVETTGEPIAYSHPSYKNVSFHDLPGIGTTKFPAANYMKEMKVEMYDFFIIISCDRFKENDAILAQECTKMKKKFYFVRSKIDEVLRSEERSRRNFNADETLQVIREDCITSLQALGVTSPQVFLVSSFDLHLYDFNSLIETMEIDLPSLKKNALLFSLPCISHQLIDKKKHAFKTHTMYRALASLTVAAIPFPGLSTSADVVNLISAIIQYRSAFGLDDKSVEYLAFITHSDVNVLKSIRTSPFANNDVNKELIINLISKSATYTALNVAEEALRFIPVIGTCAAMGISFGTTYSMLNMCLDMAADDAHNLLKAALPMAI